MNNNYLRIQREYLQKVWLRPANDLACSLPGEYRKDCFYFRAFGQACQLCESQVLLDQQPAIGPEGLLVAMYASLTVDRPVQLLHDPIAFKQLPGTMPYWAAFSAHAELVLVPYVSAIESMQKELISSFSGHSNNDAVSGDFSFTLYPLPRVPLYYIFNRSDDEFPASVTCLFAANALDYMPVDGLADVAEYTSKKVKSLVSKSQ